MGENVADAVLNARNRVAVGVGGENLPQCVFGWRAVQVGHDSSSRTRADDRFKRGEGNVAERATTRQPALRAPPVEL